MTAAVYRGRALLCLVAVIACTSVLVASEWADQELPGDKGVADEFDEVSPAPEVIREEKIVPNAALRAVRPGPRRQDRYYLEAAFLLFMLVYLVTMWIGRKKNEHITLAWARTFCGEGGVLHNNFAQLGPGDSEDGEMLMKQSQHNFQLYASGRRYCTSLLATLDLAARQDLLSLAYYLYEPRGDVLEMDILMNDAHMPPMCLLVATPKLAKAMAKSRRDLAMYAKPVEVGRDRVRDWPGSKLSVLSESAALFFDIFSEPVMELAFVGPVRFKFNEFSDQNTLMDMAMKLIDVVGHYASTMPAKLREKAEALRAEEQRKADKESRRAQDEELQKKKQERKEQELERVKKLGPEARSKFEERQKRIEQQRLLRKRTIKG